MRLSWAGLEWEPLGDNGAAREPGPNRWSPELVSMEDGELVLRVRREGRGWCCACARTVSAPGHGLFTWEVSSRVDQLDTQAVGGLFLGRFDGDVPYAMRPERNVCGEIDIEFSRWGDPASRHNAQYLPQPWEHERRYRFLMKLGCERSRHDILWTPEGIGFASCHGHPRYVELQHRPELRIASWHYRGVLNPPDLGQRVHVSLWLHRGEPPRGDGGLDMRLRSFRHLALS